MAQDKDINESKLTKVEEVPCRNDVTSELEICSQCGRPYYKGNLHTCPSKSP